MDPSTVALFFGLLLFGGAAGTIAAFTVPAVRDAVVDHAHAIAAAVAVGATAGSLWFSESAGFVPCDLCWYQRIAMYPLALVLTASAIRRDRSIIPYGIGLAAVGLVIALYHIQIQAFPEQSTFCAIENPCSGTWVEAFGFVTIPQMAALSFALVIGMLLLARQRVPAEPDSGPRSLV